MGLISIYTGFLLDLIFGDPLWFPHPVRFIGNFIKHLEYRLLNMKYQKLAGCLLLILTVSITYFITWFLLHLSFYISPVLYFLLNTFFIYTIFATRSLDVEVRKVYNSLCENDIFQARKYLSYIVSRETDELNEDEIIRAAVETEGENIVDGIISPMFYIFIGGPALGMAYKAVNTLDSMVGYKNKKYINFGWASARFDDLANYIPARLTGFIFIPLAALLYGKDFIRSIKTVIRDRYKHKSPNSGHSEAAVAGALGIQLGGTSRYFGELIDKPVIGDRLRSLKRDDIIDAIRLMYITSVIGLLAFTQIVHIYVTILSVY